MPKVKVANVFWKIMSELGIKDVFGYPGGNILPVYESTKNFPEINVYETSHEQGCSFGASAYSRINFSKNHLVPGVCMATSGPGATNMITGIYDAYMDNLPLFAITGNVTTDYVGKDAFQEANIIEICNPITKSISQPKNAEELIRDTYKLFYETIEPRTRPVLLDIKKDIGASYIEVSDAQKWINQYKDIYKSKGTKDYSFDVNIEKQIDKLNEMISESNKAVILLGNGVKLDNCEEKVTKWLESNNVVVGSSLHGASSYQSDKNFVSFPGLHGSYQSNYAFGTSDLVISIGARFDDRLTGGSKSFFAPNAKIVHIEIDKSEKNRNIPVDLFINTTVYNFTKYFKKIIKIDQEKFVNNVMSKRKGFLSNDNFNEQYVANKVLSSVKGAEIFTDVGQHQMFVSQAFVSNTKNKNNLWTSGGAGTMGYCLPAAIGSAINPLSKETWGFVGDGGFLMTATELATLKEHDAPVQIVLFNNNFLGMVRQLEEVGYDNVILGVSTSKRNPNFFNLAKSFGHSSYQVSTKSEFDNVFNNLDKTKTNVIICNIESLNNVFPHKNPGTTYENIIFENNINSVVPIVHTNVNNSSEEF